VIPSDTPDPPPTSELWYGTTIFGSSWFNYKKHTISNPQNRLSQVNYDIAWNGNRGAGVLRTFEDGVMQSWANATNGLRARVPMCYSWKDGAGVNNSSESTFKQRFRDFLDDGRSANRRVWLCFHHEFDNDGNMSNGNLHTGEMGNWYDRQIWLREVLDGDGGSQYAADAAKNGGWVKTGFITVGQVFNPGVNPLGNRAWRTYCDNMLIHAGYSTSNPEDLANIWDYGGMDKYNPGWKADPMKYVTPADYLAAPTAFHDRYGLPFLIGESGSPRITQSGTVAQRNANRAAWLDAEYAAIKETGWVDACMYWRVPSNGDQWNAWSTNMVTPNGYNATLPGAYSGSGAQSQGGFDDQLTSDVISEYCLNSIDEANALGLGPNIPYYTGGGGFG